jgi:hypothetical protein
MINDYMHENERLKHENQHISSIETDYLPSSDDDICYLTLKWLTYEVAQRTSIQNNEQLSILTNDSEQDLKQQFNDTERQVKIYLLGETLSAPFPGNSENGSSEKIETFRVDRSR